MIDDANKAITGIEDFSGVVRNTPNSATDKLQSVLEAIDTVSPIITPLKTFNFIANGIADVLASYLHPVRPDLDIQIHPYAKAVLSIFTCASKVRCFPSINPAGY